jgi:hypothetical protein
MPTESPRPIPIAPVACDVVKTDQASHPNQSHSNWQLTVCLCPPSIDGQPPNLSKTALPAGEDRTARRVAINAKGCVLLGILRPASDVRPTSEGGCRSLVARWIYMARNEGRPTHNRVRVCTVAGARR